MRHKVAGRNLSRSTEHRWALYRNQVTALLDHEKITTTEAKAREVRGLAEKMITLAKDGSLASRREALAFITEKKVVNKLFAEIGPSYADRRGGYTRLLKLGPRPGDSAPMVQVELVK
ncbi:MAG: 50S ribosomal protein L17 [Dehalococcoidia bacterium]|jgi:large subunit ribosomal protein L17|nr:50S ribosomal protein L17 [Dehalococcoidia bacterium]